MQTLMIKFPNGQVHELRIERIVSIDGVAFEGMRQVDAGNLEDRLKNLELLVRNVCSFLDEKFPPSPQNVQQAAAGGGDGSPCLPCPTA